MREAAGMSDGYTPGYTLRIAGVYPLDIRQPYAGSIRLPSQAVRHLHVFDSLSQSSSPHWDIGFKSGRSSEGSSIGSWRFAQWPDRT